MDRLVENASIYFALSDEPWDINPDSKKSDKASVRVSIICFSSIEVSPIILDGMSVPGISSDLRLYGGSSTEFLRSRVRSLIENKGIANQGIIPRGEVKSTIKREYALPGASFLISSEIADALRAAPLNPNGRSNDDVITPFLVGEDIIDRPKYRYLIDFTGLSEQEAALYEGPYKQIYAVRLHRSKMNQPEPLARWWVPWNNRDRLRAFLAVSQNYIATPRNSKHRVFVTVPSSVIPDCEVVAIARDDNTTLGVLSSKFHEIWTLHNCSFYGVGNTPRYSHKSTFDTFAFPEGLTPDIPATDYADDPRAKVIASAAARLTELRDNWLNPPDLTERISEVVPSFLDRIQPVDEKAAGILKKRTLTNLYNERPVWLEHAHRDLDRAVAAAYGWQADFDSGALTDDEVLKRLFALNQERAHKKS